MEIRVYEDRPGDWRWRAISGSRIVADSGEGYATKANAIRAAERLKATAATATITVVGDPPAAAPLGLRKLVRKRAA